MSMGYFFSSGYGYAFMCPFGTLLTVMASLWKKGIWFVSSIKNCG
jgi:hypothetical protein